MRRLGTITAALVIAAAAALLASAALSATRVEQVVPDHGPPGTSVHVSIVDTGPHPPQRDLVMSPARPYGGVIECDLAEPVYPLGVITWSGSNGTADFVVPDVPAGDYELDELLPGVLPDCMPAGWFTVTSMADTALPRPPDRMPIAPIALLAAILAAAALLVRSRLAR